jgi:biopolymer transport protein ExbB
VSTVSRLSLIVALLACALTLAWFGPSVQARQLDDLLTTAREVTTRALADEQAREQHFIGDRDQLQARVEQARAKLETLEAEAETLTANIADADGQLDGLFGQLQRQAGGLSDTTGIMRQTARELLTRLQASLVSAQFPGRLQPLQTLADAKTLPSVAQIEALWLTLLQELVESGNIARFDAPVVGSDGRSRKQTVLRIGVFDAVSKDGFLNLEQGRLHRLPRQPSGDELAIANAYFTATGEPDDKGLQPMVIDPSRGEWLAMLIQTPSRWERLQQGGSIGYLILALGALGLLLGLWRLLALALTAGRMERQLDDPDHPHLNNPLGRVLAAYPETIDDDQTPEDIEAQLHEAVLREIPRLNRGQTLLKLLAAVTPLLGLLGTVTGMIVTFQAISLFGTGDPRLMADGISQALMTTILGLGVSIPLLFLHSGVLSRGRALIQILDEESAGLVVRRQLGAAR